MHSFLEKAAPSSSSLSTLYPLPLKSGEQIATKGDIIPRSGAIDRDSVGEKNKKKRRREDGNLRVKRKREGERE